MDAPRKRKHRNRKSQQLVERDTNGPSNHMWSSQSTRHMFYLKSLEGPIVVEATPVVKSSKLKGGKVRVSILRAIFEPCDQTFSKKRLTSEKNYFTEGRNDASKKKIEKKRRARVSETRVSGTTLMVL